MSHAKTCKPIPRSKDGDSLFDWLWELVGLSAEGMDYRQATAKQLVDDFFWADSNLNQLFDEMRWVGECMREPLLQDDVEFRTSQLGFWKEAYRLLPYFMAVAKTTGAEILKRTNRNQVNRWFGTLMLAGLRQDQVVQNKALKKLLSLARGIAYNKGWFPPDELEGWDGAVDQAVYEQWNRYKDLDRKQIFEHMAGNQFRFVGKAIGQRCIDEIRPEYSQSREHFSEEFWESLVSEAPDPEELLLESEWLSGLLESDESLAPYERGFYTALDELIQIPGVLSMTESQVREEATREVARVRQVSERQARKDMRKVRAEVDKNLARIAKYRPRRKPRAIPPMKKPLILDDAEN